MKKFLSVLAIVLPFVLTSCSDEPEGPITISETSLDLTVGMSDQLTASEKGTWTSSNEFVATVNNDGKVEALHVGETVITITKGDRSANCKVVVKASNTSYSLPYMVWGADADAVKAANTSLNLYEEMEIEGGVMLSYLTATALPGYIYMIDSTEGLIATSMVVDIDDADNFEDFLYQYFADLNEDEEWFYLIDSNSAEGATIAVQYGMNDEESLIATFMPIPDFAEVRSLNDIKSLFEGLKFNRTIFKNI